MVFVEMDEANKRIREIKNRAEKAETRMCELENLIQWCSVCGYSNDLGRGLCRQCLNRLGSPSVGTPRVGETENGECIQDCDALGIICPNKTSGSEPARVPSVASKPVVTTTTPARGPEEAGATLASVRTEAVNRFAEQPTEVQQQALKNREVRKHVDAVREGQRPAEPLMPSKSGMLWAPYEIDMLARAVRRAHEALNIDMGDGEPTYQCCNAVCGHCNCVVGDAVRLLEKRSADPLRTSEAKPCEACENAKSDPMALYFCEEHGTNVPPGLNMPEATRPRSNEAKPLAVDDYVEVNGIARVTEVARGGLLHVKRVSDEDGWISPTYAKRIDSDDPRLDDVDEDCSDNPRNESDEELSALRKVAVQARAVVDRLERGEAAAPRHVRVGRCAYPGEAMICPACHGSRTGPMTMSGEGEQAVVWAGPCTQCDGTGHVRDLTGGYPPEPLANDELRTCWCFDCLDAPEHGMQNPTLRQMILCPACGNKRCPRATDHRFACTGSNEPGQFGSRYGERPWTETPRVEPLINWPPYKRAHDALHKLWSKTPSGDGYVKKEWLELEEAIGALARSGEAKK